MKDILWTSAAPLWAERNDSDLSGFRRPTILRFANDLFMDEFMQVLENQPARLADYRVWPETWRDPLPPPAPVPVLPPALRELQRKKRAGTSPALEPADSSDPTRPLKLYQPAHQRYYLVTASLVCRQVGLPDRAVDTGAQENTSFVLRRLMLAKPEDFTTTKPPDPDQAAPGVYDEYAFVTGEWRKVTDGKSLVPGEELNPLFSVCYFQTDGRRRRLFGGLIPAGRREAYINAKKVMGTPLTNGVEVTSRTTDPRLELLLRRIFFDPWNSLIRSAFVDAKKMNDDIIGMPHGSYADTDNRKTARSKQETVITQRRRQIQETSWYLLLDLANFLDQHMRPVLEALKNNSVPAEISARNVVNILKAISLPGEMQRAIDKACKNEIYHSRDLEIAASLGSALSKIQTYQPYLESAGEPYKCRKDDSAIWPNFLFPLVDLAALTSNEEWVPALNLPCTDNNKKYEAVAVDPPRPPQVQIKEQEPTMLAVQMLLDDLYEVMLAALPARSPELVPPVSLAAEISRSRELLSINETGWFRVRCVFERPNCLPVPQPLLSDPSAAFQLAGFFDPDAPARPIRIALPVDTSPAGLRKFDKNAAFILSDILCGQVKRIKNIGFVDLVLSVLPWPFHKDLPMTDTGPCEDGGMICSLSIPIVTVCALIMLIIFVSLFDMIFHWFPFLMECFPLSKFTAKAEPS